VLLRHNGDRTGGAIEYGARNGTDPARKFAAAVGNANNEQLCVSRHRGHCVARRALQSEGFHVEIGVVGLPAGQDLSQIEPGVLLAHCQLR
jgi:hypothetical protein